MKPIIVKDSHNDRADISIKGDSIRVYFHYQKTMFYTVEQAQQLITALQNAVIELQFGGEKNEER